MVPLTELVDRLRSHYDDACFACGRANPIGLRLDGFTEEGGGVAASFEPRPHYRGTPEVLHGGIAATALDEILVWAGILTHGVMSVTATLEVRFRNPTPLDGRLDVRARIDDRRGKRMRASGEILSRGRVMVEGKALLLVTQDISELLNQS